MPARSLLRTAAVVALGLGLGMLAGCTDADPSPSADLTTTTVDATTTTDPTLQYTPEQLVQLLALGDDDAAPGEDVVVTAQGEPAYHEDPTLAHCSYQLITEAARTERYRVQVRDDDAVVATSDAVLYTPREAELALVELRSGVERCAEGEVVPPNGDQPDSAVPTVWTAEPLDDEAQADLTEDHVALTITETPEGGETTTRTVIVQRRGDVLIVTSSPDEPRALAFAATATERLRSTVSYLFGDD